MRVTRSGGSLPWRLLRFVFILLFLFCIARFAIFHSFFPSTRSASSLPAQILDDHPIRRLMGDADREFEKYNSRRSRTFSQAVTRYRREHGRHPPPGFDKWYTFARKHKVQNIDDFKQIHDDLRPFWAVEPADLRAYAAHASDKIHHGVATISIRNGRVFDAEDDSWRSEDFLSMLRSIAGYLPDMDIPMNRMDQPRVIVPWDDIQAAMKIEMRTRHLESDRIIPSFTKGLSGLSTARPKSAFSKFLSYFSPSTSGSAQDVMQDEAPIYGWFSHVNKPFMDLATEACPTGAYAREPESDDHFHRAEDRYKHPIGGFVKNYNLSTSLCVVGPQLSELHGLLNSATSMFVTQKLLPIFSESKMNVNNDILFPGSIYYKRDSHYLYRESQDPAWQNKDPVLFWRGSTSGGNAYFHAPEKWSQMHRQRLVLLTNATEIANISLPLLTTTPNDTHNYAPTDSFHPAPFAAAHTDTAFTSFIACLPTCDFYASVFTLAKWLPLASNFAHKFLLDIDGHAFSGRWRAYLLSRSLALKASLLREWHDSRLTAWRHFVPVDNRYDDLYGVLTYFAGWDSSSDDEKAHGRGRGRVLVPPHDFEAYTIAERGREWAAKVLRREDMEVYLYRLLLEYARLIDDERLRIGYVGDGGREMERVDERYPAVDF